MRIQIESADDIARAYVVLSEQLAAPKSPALTEKLGELCKTCGSGPSVQVTVTAQAELPDEPQAEAPERTKLVCFKCGRDWVGVDVEAVRQFGGTRKSAGGLSEGVADMMQQWGMVRALIEDRPQHYTQSRWEYVTLCLIAFLDPRVGTYENVATYGAQRFKRRRWEWSPARVRTAVGQARRELERRGQDSGLLARPARQVRVAPTVTARIDLSDI